MPRFEIADDDLGRYVRRKSIGQIGRVKRDPRNGWLYPDVVYEWESCRDDLEYVLIETDPRG